MSSPLRIVVINHVHPKHKHVSALRMRTFSEHLARGGDQVILLSDAYDAADTATEIKDLPTRLKTYDWSHPLFVSGKPQGETLQKKAREGRLPGIIRQAVLGWSYLWTGGVFGDWRMAAMPLLPEIAQSFRPDIVLATFGNTDAWAIARALAVHARCPWIADMKDNWSAFIPIGFRRMTARRFNDMAHMTLYSESHKLEADKWFSGEKTVVYSGYDNDTAALATKSFEKSNTIVLSGSLYNDNHLQMFCDGIHAWVNRAQITDPVSLLYAGDDTARFERVASALDGTCSVKSLGYLEPDNLRALQASALANAYIVNPGSLFQQKLPELLAAARPIIVLPDESAEAVHIAKTIGGTLHCCTDADAVSDALRLCVSTPGPVPTTGIESYSWAVQTNRLRGVMLRMVNQKR